MAHARNRVTPLGDIEAIQLRGAWTGNRGILHQDREIVRSHAGERWITCALSFGRERKLEQWQPGHYTVLFFHDEAVSFAAGHRPCARCRRERYNAYRAAWSQRLCGEAPSSTQIDRQLHVERCVHGTSRRRIHALPWAELPDGAFALLAEVPVLVLGGKLVAWTREGYKHRHARPVRGIADVITPPSTIAVLSAGDPVQIDAAAFD